MTSKYLLHLKVQYKFWTGPFTVFCTACSGSKVEA